MSMGGFVNYDRHLILQIQIRKTTKASTIIKAKVDLAEAPEPLRNHRVTAANLLPTVYFAFKTQAPFERLPDAKYVSKYLKNIASVGGVEMLV